MATTDPVAIAGPGFTVTADLVNHKDARIRASQAQNLAGWMRWAASVLNDYVERSVQGSFAPTDSSFITATSESALSSERVLTAGPGISRADGGAGGAMTIKAVSSPADSTTLAGTGFVMTNQLGGTLASPDVRGIRETGGPTLLTIGGIADGEYVKRSGSTAIGGSPPFVDHVLQYFLATPSVLVGPLTNSPLIEFAFNGTDDYPSGMSDIFLVFASSTGTSTNAFRLQEKSTDVTVATVTVGVAAALGAVSTTTFSNLPTGVKRFQLQATVAAGDTMTINSALWRRKR